MTRVKICGVTRLEDARLAAEMGAWAVGTIFFGDSPRACDPDVAEQIGAELKRKAEVAGVFVNASLDEVAELADRCRLTLLQLHGDEGPAYCREAARRTGCRVMKAVRVKDAASVRRVESFREVDLHLLDTHTDAVRGGTGTTFDWELVRHHRSRVPVVLSGGIDPANAADAIAAVHPYAVDSASGTEAEPGVKDPAKVEALIAAARAADAARAA
ncbi:MAG: phosphoribosylanthranilate isomerase [Thermoleophilaceae bacterium]|jgi:phosphoribosylanthranilate isomerase|nr:phosphoribosylanthranilate isomerase [Thermoleophilaceae bacterium]MEA2353193.1 phosphoribosylanthranilate isomerase [Thermoleophilaceae bacterium]MEA2368850.1 phosphoribosylanthranilate isomerase [Thermoleophilaceae bacterium]